MALGLTIQEIIECGEFPLLVVHDTWQRVLLDDVATVQNGYAFSSDGFTKTNGMPLIRIRDINRSITQDYFNGKYPDEYVVNAGDILIGMDGDFNIARWKGERALLNQRVCRLKHSSEFYCEKFLVFVLPSFLNAINAKTSSVTVKHLSSKTITEIQLPLPPLAEQHRIVAKIEELFSELDNGIETLKKAKQQLKIYRQAVLKYAFEGKLTNPDVKDGELPEGWEFNELSDVGVWRGGGTPSKSNMAFWENGTIDWVTSKDMKSDIILNTIDTITPDSIAHSSTKLIPANSVLIVMRSGILRRTLPISMVQHEVTINQDLQALTPVDTNIKYLFWCLKSSSETIRRICSKDGTTVESIDSSALKRFQIAIAPKDQQERIVQEIESRLSVCDKIEESIEQGVKQAEALRQSILKRAFEGKLVAQDPSDEPANVLLERIKAERAAKNPVKKTSTKKSKA